MTHETSTEGHIILNDTDFVDEAETPTGHRKPFPLPFDRKVRPPSNPEDSGSDVLERSEELDAAFLQSVQHNLAKFGQRPGGKATDYRSLKHWDAHIRDADVPAIDSTRERVWKDIIQRYASSFDVEHADENDFIVLVEYPDGECFPIPIRRVPEVPL